MDEKKANLYLILSFILNFCLTFTIIWTLGILLYMNMHNEEMWRSCGSRNDFAAVKDNGNTEPADDDLVALTEPEPRVVDIEIKDNGYANNSFEFGFGEEVTFTLRNTGLKPHSFVIDELSVDSGLIEGGNFRVVKIEALPSNEATYTFHSNASGDEPGVFSGVITVKDLGGRM